MGAIQACIQAAASAATPQSLVVHRRGLQPRVSERVGDVHESAVGQPPQARQAFIQRVEVVEAFALQVLVAPTAAEAIQGDVLRDLQGKTVLVIGDNPGEVRGLVTLLTCYELRPSHRQLITISQLPISGILDTLVSYAVRPCFASI